MCYKGCCCSTVVELRVLLQVRHMLASHGRLHEVTQVILNPSDEPYFNVMSTMSNKEDVKVGLLRQQLSWEQLIPFELCAVTWSLYFPT